MNNARKRRIKRRRKQRRNKILIELIGWLILSILVLAFIYFGLYSEWGPMYQ